MPPDGRVISVTDPISLAISRAKLITFQPFDLGKWFTLGFVAFLASLGQGGCKFNFRGGGGGGGGPAPPGLPTPGVPAPPPDPFDEIWDWITTHPTESTLLAIGVVLALSAIWLVLLWIGSRGQFMFLENIANNTSAIVAPWKRHRVLANSLFAFRAVLALTATVAMLLVLGAALLLAWPDIDAEQFGPRATAAIVLLAGVLLPSALAFALIDWCTYTFVATIMYATGARARASWHEFRQNVVRGHVGRLVLFLILNMALGLAVVVLTVLLGCATCCLGFLPYLSNVVTLPLSVFMRSYSVYFLQQFDPRYVIIVEQIPPGMGFPVVPFPPGQAYGYGPPYAPPGMDYPQPPPYPPPTPPPRPPGAPG